MSTRLPPWMRTTPHNNTVIIGNTWPFQITIDEPSGGKIPRMSRRTAGAASAGGECDDCGQKLQRRGGNHQGSWHLWHPHKDYLPICSPLPRLRSITTSLALQSGRWKRRDGRSFFSQALFEMAATQNQRLLLMSRRGRRSGQLLWTHACWARRPSKGSTIRQPRGKSTAHSHTPATCQQNISQIRVYIIQNAIYCLNMSFSHEKILNHVEVTDDKKTR